MEEIQNLVYPNSFQVIWWLKKQMLYGNHVLINELSSYTNKTSLDYPKPIYHVRPIRTLKVPISTVNENLIMRLCISFIKLI